MSFSSPDFLPELAALAALLVLATLTFAATVAWLRLRKPYDRDLLVIGAGAGGLVAAYTAAQLQARVTLVEAGAMGGDCLNTGCVPSKALIRRARLIHEAQSAAARGLLDGAPTLHFATLMQEIAATVATIAPNDSAERYRALGVEVIEGRATLEGPHTVAIATQTGQSVRLTARRIVLATGAEPAIPAITGLTQVPFLTSATLWARLHSLEALPERWVVLGGGAIGCELAQALRRLGAKVTLIERESRLVPGEDAEVAAHLLATLAAEGVDIRLGQAVLRVEAGARAVRVSAQAQGQEAGGEAIPFDELLVATGRWPRLAGMGLEKVGLLERDHLAVDRFLRTRVPSIYAVGDVISPRQLTSAAAHQAWGATVNALLGNFRAVDPAPPAMPRVIYTDPEVASLGLHEEEASRQGLRFEVTRFDLAQIDRAVIDAATPGWVKVLTRAGSDKILGVTLVAPHAGELIAEYALAMRQGIGLRRLLGAMRAYPTYSEIGTRVAGQWQTKRLPRWLRPLLRLWHGQRAASASASAPASRTAETSSAIESGKKP